MVKQSRFVAHVRVDCRQNCRLQRFFLDRRRIVAVFCAVVQAAGAAPDRIFSSERCPCAAPVECPALAAHKPVRQRVFACITGASCHSRFGRAAQGAPTCHFCFYCIVLLPADDGFMVVRHSHKHLSSMPLPHLYLGWKQLTAMR